MVISELVSYLGFRVDQSGARQFDAQMDRLQRRADSVATGIAAGMSAALTNFAGNLALRVGEMIGGALKAIPVAGDAMTNAVSQIEQSIEQSAISGQEAVAIYEKLYEIGTRTGISANDSAAAFSRMNGIFQDLGLSVGQTIQLLEGIQSAGLISGARVEDVREAVRQLGQALSSGKLNGENLITLSERMPRLVQDLRKELGMSQKEFIEAGSKGLLTAEAIIPALLKVSDKAVEAYSRAPLEMATAYQMMRNSALRFAAELDKQLRLSQTIGKIFQFIGRTIDSWRGSLSVIGRMVDDLGGLEGIARLVAAALVAMFAPQILSGIAGLMTGFVGLLGVLRTMLIPLASIVMWAAIIEDAFVWMQGGKSLFGDKLGAFSDFIKPVVDAWEAFKTDFVNIPVVLEPIFTRISELTGITGEDIKRFLAESFNVAKEAARAFLADVMGIPAAISGVWENIKTITSIFLTSLTQGWNNLTNDIKFAFNSLISFFQNLVAIIRAPFDSFFSWFDEKLNTVRGLGQRLGLLSAGPENGRREQDFQGPAFPAMSEFFNSAITPDVSGRIGNAGNNVSAPVTADIDIHVTAPGADPASVANATRNGVVSGLGESGMRLGDSMARALSLSNPRIEAPASP